MSQYLDKLYEDFVPPPKNTQEVLWYAEVLSSKAMKVLKNKDSQEGKNIKEFFEELFWGKKILKKTEFNKVKGFVISNSGNIESEIRKQILNYLAQKENEYERPRLQEKKFKPTRNQILFNQSIAAYFKGIGRHQTVEKIINGGESLFNEYKLIFEIGAPILFLYNVGKIISKRNGKQFDKQVIDKFLLGITQKFKIAVGYMDGQGVGNTLYGLQNMNEVPKELLSILAERIESMNGEMDGQGVGNALYGLQNISEVPKELLRALAKRIESMNGEMNGQNIGNALYGLQNMSGVPKELLSVLAKRIESMDGEINSQNVGNAMYGLQNMSGVPKELLSVLVKRIESMNGEMDGQGIGNALYGLQSMSEVPNELLNVLAKRIESMSGEMDRQNIGNALYGLKNLSSDKAIEIQNYLFAKLEQGNYKYNQEYIAYVRQIYAIYNREFPNHLKIIYDESVGLFTSGSHTEFRVFDNIKDTYEEALHNHFIDGFELDIYIPSKKINIEIDGVYHRGARLQRNIYRDNYLKKVHQITVERIVLNSSMTQADIMRIVNLILE